MSHERTGELTLKGNPLTVIGPRLKPGDKFPAVKLTAPDWSEVDLSTFSGSVRLISVVPSSTPASATPRPNASMRRPNGWVTK